MWLKEALIIMNNSVICVANILKTMELFRPTYYYYMVYGILEMNNGPRKLWLFYGTWISPLWTVFTFSLLGFDLCVVAKMSMLNEVLQIRLAGNFCITSWRLVVYAQNYNFCVENTNILLCENDIVRIHIQLELFRNKV